MLLVNVCNRSQDLYHTELLYVVVKVAGSVVGSTRVLVHMRLPRSTSNNGWHMWSSVVTGAGPGSFKGRRKGGTCLVGGWDRAGFWGRLCLDTC